MIDTLAVVGATGAVGRIILDLLAARKFPAKRLKLLASARSAGTPVRVGDAVVDVEVLTPDSFVGVDLAIGSTPDEVAAEFVPWAVERGTVVVDESAFYRMHPDVPLVIPEVNPEALATHKGIIASPNSIMPMARPIPKWTSTAIARQSRRVSRGQTRAA